MKSSEEIVAINEKFWSENYLQILSLMPREVYAAKTSFKDDEVFKLFGVTWASLLGGIQTGFVTYDMIELFSKPDFSNPLTLEYIESFKTGLNSDSELELFMGYLGTQVYSEQKVISLI